MASNMTNREVSAIAQFSDCLNTTYTDEGQLLDRVELLLRFVEAPYVRVLTATETGVSDLLICYHGNFVACELKNATRNATPAQSEFIRRIIRSGGRGGICRSISEVAALLFV